MLDRLIGSLLLFLTHEYSIDDTCHRNVIHFALGLLVRIVQHIQVMASQIALRMDKIAPLSLESLARQAAGIDALLHAAHQASRIPQPVPQVNLPKRPLGRSRTLRCVTPLPMHDRELSESQAFAVFLTVLYKHVIKGSGDHRLAAMVKTVVAHCQRRHRAGDTTPLQTSVTETLRPVVGEETWLRTQVLFADYCQRRSITIQGDLLRFF